MQNKENVTRIDIVIPYPWWYWGLIIGAIVFAIVLFYAVMKAHQHRYPEVEDEVEDIEYVAPVEPEETEEEELPEIADEEEMDDDNAVFSVAERAEITTKLRKIIETDKGFLKIDMSTAKAAKMIGIPTHRLSAYFNQCLHQTFPDYINRLRVEEFKRMAKEQGTDSYTLNTMSRMCGFGSRSTFFRLFKKYEGITPAEYIKRLSSEE